MGLSSPEWISDLDTGVFSGTLFDTEFLAVACTIVILSVYLPRAEHMENMLRPACSALILVVISSILSLDAPCPAAALAGSPGTICTMTNKIMMTPANTLVRYTDFFMKNIKKFKKSSFL